MRSALAGESQARESQARKRLDRALVLGTCVTLLGLGATPAVVDIAPMAVVGAQPPGCTVPSGAGALPGEKIADPACDYDYQSHTYSGTFIGTTNSAGAAVSTAYTGIFDHTAYRIEVPKAWNGALVLYAHPYHGLGNVVWVDDPSLRSWFVSHGYAWAASSFAANGYDIGHGVTDTHDLLEVFASRTHAKAKAVYLTGESMGAQVAAVEAEDFKGSFAGAMPECAPLGDTQLYDYYLGVNATAAALTKVPITFPLQPSIASVIQYAADVAALILPGLGTGFLTPAGPTLTSAGKEWATAVSYLSGGPRAGFDSALAYWTSTSYGPLTGMPTLFDLYPGLDGGTAGIASGNVVTNVGVTYHADGSAAPTAADKALNAAVLRVKATTATPPGQLSGIPPIVGDPGIPVLALYGTGDLLVPLSMGQVYAQRMAGHGESKLFVARAIREVGHCDFSTAELSQGFAALVSWVNTGHAAAGDDITSPAAVASPDFGCRFTDGSHPGFVAPPCPASATG